MASEATKWILVVADDEEGREALVELLEEAGYPTRGAGRGGAALEMLKTAEPCLVLSDFALGDMDAKELRRQVRDLLGISAPPFVLLTGMHPALLKDISGTILAKPIDSERLLSVVAKHWSA